MPSHELTADQIEFLTLLHQKGGIVTRKELPLADRTVDKMRKSLRSRGLTEFVGGHINGRHHSFGWRITPRGVEALEATRNDIDPTP